MEPDPVELIMTIEEQFGITVPDSDAEEITTLGRLHSYILFKTGVRSLEFCPSSRTFYRLRQALMTEFAARRERVTTAARVDDLLPRSGRRQRWEHLRTALGGWEMPRLERPVWAHVTVVLTAVAMFFSCAWMVALAAHKQPAVLAATAFVASAALFQVTYWLTGRFAVELPEGCSTVRGLVTALLRWNFGRLLTESGGFQCDATWEKLTGIISAWCGANPTKLTPDTRFDEDLSAK